MKESLILMIKGFVLGVANIIPGVSGGTLAITLGIYEDIINSISHFFKDFKKNMKFLIPIGIGAVLSILLMSKVITYSLKQYPFPTTLFFIGLIVGGLPLLFKKVKGKPKKASNIVLFLITFSIVMVMSLSSEINNTVSLNNLGFIKIIKLLLVGAVAAATMVIPGISGSFVLMLLGYYQPIVETISNLTNFKLLIHNFSVLIPFGIGVLVGIILIAKLIEYLFKKYEVPTYYAILGFVVASIIGLFIGLIGLQISIMQFIIGLVLFILSFGIGYKLGDE